MSVPIEIGGAAGVIEGGEKKRAEEQVMVRGEGPEGRAEEIKQDLSTAVLQPEVSRNTGLLRLGEGSRKGMCRFKESERTTGKRLAVGGWRLEICM